ncbi:hypothetical protein LSCM1_00741 [Leishmania martiniquensis]|uniref:C2H2-type domain-containing protein n=1 Tax=Leishmania martiniquensis TaxID=1580590 RepID=A0A836GG07_9TRYP|nr:hypothetical protein LSCM1_00741 [Leishmania martiniquensis]
MQRRIGAFAAAAAYCGALRWLRRVSASSLPGPRAVTAAYGSSSAALAEPVRNQSATPDRRFHCSVCKKSFRLEMAAKLHLQQVHSGEGTVELGSGPGQGEEQAPQTPVGVLRNAPPQAPTVVSPNVLETHERCARRVKPAPKPLHEAEREVPSLVMEKMLSVWDDTGVKRMGKEFIHSSMVMRVFAARPWDSAEPLYGAMTPEGENPFEGGPCAADAAPPITTNGEKAKVYSISVSDAFAMATTESYGPLRPASCSNPFLRKLTKGAAITTTNAVLTKQQTAPVTPFGQLPMFGQAPSPAGAPVLSVVEEPSIKGSNVVSSPFAAGVNDSPFAGKADSPFAGQGYSPFAATEESGNPAATAASATPSATAAGILPPSPFAAAPSPFHSSSVAATTFEVEEAATVGRSAFGPDGELFTSVPATPENPQKNEVSASTHVCTVCKKSFSTHDGLRMHCKAKHGQELPRGPQKGKREVPDLPAFIPSPVDLTTTSPFGSPAQRSSWTEVELTPYAQSVSNITVAGRVLDCEVSSDGALLFSLFVPGSAEREAEVIPVRCSSGAHRAFGESLVRGDHVFACGSLRVLPFTDEKTQKMYSSAVVYVARPTGIIAKLN